MSKFEKALEHVFFVEGGYSDHPDDKGGETKYGITEKTYNSYVRNSCTRDVWPVLKDIDKRLVYRIYQSMYWDKVRGDELPPGVALMVFDSAVHAGPLRARTWLQRALGVNPDGIIGPITLAAANRTNRSSKFHEPFRIVKEIAKYRLMLGRKNDTFAKGWFNRIIHILGESFNDIFNEMV